MKKIYGIISLILIVVVGFYIYLQNRITISVIIPVYNAEKYLERCLDSIFIQSGTFEVIAVNDGSTDSSLQILKQYAKKYSNLRIIDQKNQGVSSARNAGMLIAKNKYITFIDSDDWLEPNAFELVHKTIKKDKPQILISSFYDVYDRHWIKDTKGYNSLIGVPELTKYPNHDLDELALFSPFYTKDAISDLYYSGTWVTHSFFDRHFLIHSGVHFYKEISIVEDGVFLLNLYAHNPKIAILNTPIYNYYNRISSVSKSLNTLKELINTMVYLRKTDEYKKSPRYIQLYMDDALIYTIFVGIANLQRHGVPLSDGLPEIYKIMEKMYKYSQQELKSARNYQKIKSYLQQIGFNQPL